MRVTSRLWPAATIRSAIAAICSGVLPGTENDLGKALPDAAVVIDAGEAQIFERRLAQILKEPVVRSSGVSAPDLHFVQQRAELQAVHRAK